MALYYGKKQISGGRDYKIDHQMEDYSVSFVDDGEGYTDAAAALSEINSGSKFGKLFAAIKGCLMKFLSSISSLSSDLTALQNKATELQNTITELENKATELQEKTTTLENGLTSCNSDYNNLNSSKVDKEACIPNGSDFDTITVSGFYRYNVNSTYTNCPPNVSWGQMLVIHGGLDTIVQMVFPYGDGTYFYVRNGNPPNVNGTGSYSKWAKYTGINVN